MNNHPCEICSAPYTTVHVTTIDEDGEANYAHLCPTHSPTFPLSHSPPPHPMTNQTLIAKTKPGRKFLSVIKTLSSLLAFLITVFLFFTGLGLIAHVLWNIVHFGWSIRF